MKTINQFPRMAEESVIDAISERNSPDVDNIINVNSTCHGIMEAVQSALDKAAG